MYYDIGVIGSATIEKLCHSSSAQIEALPVRKQVSTPNPKTHPVCKTARDGADADKLVVFLEFFWRNVHADASCTGLSTHIMADMFSERR